MYTDKKFLNSFVFLDGAMGTMLQKKGVATGRNPELLSVTYPEMVTAIHRGYVESGSNIIYANTFGASRKKLEGSGLSPAKVIQSSIKAAKTACRGTSCQVALDIGPLGELLEPAGTKSFNEAYEDFKEQVLAGAGAGADLVVIETMSCLLEVKAAVLAVVENSNLPFFVTMTFESNGRTFTGVSPEAAAITIETLGACAVGVNCSLGPKELFPIIAKMAAVTNLPLIVKANAGLPDPESGEYEIGAEEFANNILECVNAGASIIGGCCGTTPDYIKAVRKALSGKKPVKRESITESFVCSPNSVVSLDSVKVIGERINPTGKKLFKEALLSGDTDYILKQGITQIAAGADILDVNVGLPGINEAEMLTKIVKGLQAVTDAPLQLDSTSPAALESALRVYNGKPIVNSVNGEERVLKSILPLVKKYGASVVGLTLDENGIPKSAGERVIIAERILNAAQALGIKKEDVYIDCLTLTVSAEQEGAGETLAALREVTERLGLKTVLGISNISFGLPQRELVNASFLSLALANGLTLPIINPNISAMMDTVAAFRLLYNIDKGAKQFIKRFDIEAAKKPAAAQVAKNALPQIEDDIKAAILNGLLEDSRAITKRLLTKEDELFIISERLIPALDTVGKRYESGEIFLPQLLTSAMAAQEAFLAVRESLAGKGREGASLGSIVIATVKGDIHDIGKNIVKVILENYGYKIIDLGRDVPPETVLRAVKEHGVRLVGLSALMTTTLPAMEETIALLKSEAPKCRILVGGAVLTEDYAKKMGADYYAHDAQRSVEIAKEIFG